MGWIDLIRDGVDITGRSGPRGNAGVDSALVRSAMGAQRNNVDWPLWSNLVTQQCCSKLLPLAARDAEGNPVDLNKRLRQAWDRAAVRTANAKIESTDVPILIDRVRIWVDAGCPRGKNTFFALLEEERKGLLAGCDIGEELNTTRPALPWRKVAVVSGLGTDKRPGPTKRVLRRLDERGIMPKVEPGRPGDPARFDPWAAIYQLPVAWATVHMFGNSPVDRFSTPVDRGDHDHGPATTPVDRDDERIKKMIEEVKLSPQGLIELLEWARSMGWEAAGGRSPTELPEGVVPIRPEDRETK